MLVRLFVVRDVSEDVLVIIVSVLLIDEVKEFEVVLKSEDVVVGILLFFKLFIEFARERRESSIDSATAALVTMMLVSLGKFLMFV